MAMRWDKSVGVVLDDRKLEMARGVGDVAPPLVADRQRGRVL
jgi:hypothetical protein